MSVTITFFIAIIFSAIAVGFAGSMLFTQNFKLFPVVLVSGVLGLIFLDKFIQMYFLKENTFENHLLFGLFCNKKTMATYIFRAKIITETKLL